MRALGFLAVFALAPSPGDAAPTRRVDNGWCVVYQGGPALERNERHYRDSHPQLLYLNFDGGPMTGGRDDPHGNQSIIVPGQVDFPAFDDVPFRRGSADSREKVIDAIQRWTLYFFAREPVEVVTERPPDALDYTMIVIGGAPGDVGEPTGVLGIASFDCGQNPNNVGFVFSEDHGGSMGFLVSTIAHEAGHTFGLAHVDDESIMGTGSVDSYWGNGVTYDSQACDGTFEQDSLAVLQQMLGVREDGTPPWVEVVFPGPAAVVSPHLDAILQGTDDLLLYRTELFIDGSSYGRHTILHDPFPVLDLPPGQHQVSATGEDAHGNVTEVGPYTITVLPDCENMGSCDDGLGGFGSACELGAECQSGACVSTQDRPGMCGRPCGDSPLPCPDGTNCIDAIPERPDDPIVSYCAISPGPVTLLTDSGPADDPYALSGCSSAGGTPDSAPLLLWLLLLPLARRRR